MCVKELFDDMVIDEEEPMVRAQLIWQLVAEAHAFLAIQPVVFFCLLA